MTAGCAAAGPGRRAGRGAPLRWAGLLVLLLAGLPLLPVAPAAGALLPTPPGLEVGRVALAPAAEFVFDRDLRLETIGAPQAAEIRRFVLGGAYGLLPELEGFLALGASRLHLPPGSLPAGGRFDGEPGILFGGGLRYRFLEQPPFRVEATLFLARLESEDGERGASAAWLEYNLEVVASARVFRRLAPYVGLGVGIADGTLEGAFGRLDFRQEHVLGAVVGVRYAATAQVSAALAARVFDETALALGLGFAF
ncbi:MAG TPA: hypothetical protein VNM66_04830 [Thermodesulfobacteriota bacterium]|nr:hypothetical protein [Thermodesulfobacteriota bacterium]